MTAIFASSPGKSVMQNPAVPIVIDYLFDIRAIESIPSFKPLFVDVFERFEMVFHALIIRRVLRIALSVKATDADMPTSSSNGWQTTEAISVRTLYVELGERATLMPDKRTYKLVSKDKMV